MRILHVTESCKGGVGTYISELASQQLESLGEDAVRVLAPEPHAFQIAAVPADAKITFPRPGRSLVALTNLGRALLTAVEAFQPDLIHAHSTFAGMIVRLAYGWRRRRPVIIYCPHGWGFDMDLGRWKRALFASTERALAAWTDRIIAISEHEADAARAIGIPAGKIEVVRNGLRDVEPVMQASWPTDRLKVLFVGRLDRQKGFDTLMDALAPLAARISVRVAGDAVADRRLGHGWQQSVEMLGWLSEREIRAHLAAADLLVVPSRWEAFGLVAIEAMRAGRMVVASDVGGLREVVRHGVTGWLVAPDFPAELARRLATVTRQEAHRMGENGRRHFEAAFLRDRMHRQLNDVYRRCGLMAGSENGMADD